MASKRPVMAHRKRPGTSGVNGMAAPGPASCPTPRPTESCDLKAIPPRQRPVRYPKEPRDQKPLPRSCKAQYASPKSQDIGHTHLEVNENAEVEVKLYSNPADAEPENQRPATPTTPEHERVPDDHVRADFHGGADSLDDDSSSDYINNTSDEEEDYNDGLAEEDEGVTYYIRYCPEDDSYLEGMNCNNQGECNHNHSQSQGDGVTPMQEGEVHTEEHQEAVEGWVEEGEGPAEVRAVEWVEDEEGEGAVREEWREEEEGAREEWREGDEEAREEWREGDEEAREEWIEEGQVRQEAWAGPERHLGEEWVEGDGEVRCEVVEQDPDEQIYNGRPEPILDHHHNNHHHHQPPLTDTLHDREEEEEAESEEYCPNQEEDEEGDEEDRHGRAYTGDYYAQEDNGNSVRASPYRSRKVLVVEGETGEEAEEDIDQIVAEIKMSMSMGSLSSGTDQSPEELAQDPAPSDYPLPKPDATPLPTSSPSP
ncbi:hypothetical protein PBY51_019022 [Eleginops maclovinus]|uniref:APBA2 n=1 Tax=Eleginops maclovinus TaxID=56733 RepID=A0AAN7Y1H2_ELEMC|nr:hypothetical protein PBY51_019022 [Eleginops maclovinus]